MEKIKRLINNFKKQKKQKLSFYQELEDDYYNAYPEEWEKENNFAVGEKFVSILDKEIKKVPIPGYRGEKVTSLYIKRGKRKLWEVGKTYQVCKQLNSSNKDELIKRESNGNELRQYTQVIGPSESLGSIILIEIISNGVENILIFK